MDPSEEAATKGKVKAMALTATSTVGPAYPTLKIEPGCKDVAKISKFLAFKVHHLSFCLSFFLLISF
jgi:hypothetical protein